MEEHRYRYYHVNATLLFDKRKEKKVCATILSSSNGEGVRMNYQRSGNTRRSRFRERENNGKNIFDIITSR